MEKRLPLSITLSKEARSFLKSLQDMLILEGEDELKKYPISYIIEDMILWIASDDELFNRFLDDTYYTLPDEEDIEDTEEDEENEES